MVTCYRNRSYHCTSCVSVCENTYQCQSCILPTLFKTSLGEILLHNTGIFSYTTPLRETTTIPWDGGGELYKIH